jgi:beta-ketodecanoyl-[acyl-carrier-protein] synthase
VLGREPLPRGGAGRCSTTYANTSSSAGSIIAFHQHHDGPRARGERGVICSFGAGYSIGSVILRRR